MAGVADRAGGLAGNFTAGAFAAGGVTDGFEMAGMAGNVT